jgi:DNA-binding response OmpR family regulator
MKDKEVKTILIAEDEKPLAKALEIKFSKEGFKTFWAASGEEAINILDKEDIDFLILDLIMPKKDGYAVLEHISKKDKKIKIAVLSNLAQGEDFDKARRLGASDYFVKSDTPIIKVVEHVKNMLD